MKKLIVASVILLSSIAHADTLSIEAGVLTNHLDHESWMNEDNDLIAIEYRQGKHGVNASSFVNTYGNQTFTVGGYYSLLNYKYIELGVLYGLVKGYESDQLDTVFTSDLGVYVAPRVTAKYDITDNVDVKVSVQLFGSAVITTAGIGYSF